MKKTAHTRSTKVRVEVTETGTLTISVKPIAELLRLSEGAIFVLLYQRALPHKTLLTTTITIPAVWQRELGVWLGQVPLEYLALGAWTIFLAYMGAPANVKVPRATIYITKER